MDAGAAEKESWAANPTVRAVAMTLAFALLIGAAVIVGDTSTLNFIRTKPAKPSEMKGNPNIGHSRIPLPDGKTCRETVFNRVTGQPIDSLDVPCAVPAEIVRKTPGNFVWGGTK